MKSKARLVEVALAAGVSRQTAGAVLLGGRTNTRASEETVRRVLDAARRLNYKPNSAARQLMGLATGVIGIVCADIHEPTHTHSLIATRLMELLLDRGFMPALTVLSERTKSLDEQVADIVHRGVDGLLVIDARFIRRPESLKRLLELCPRTVLYACDYRGTEHGIHFVDIDRMMAMRLAMRHLLDRGYRRIALAAGETQGEIQYNSLAGYRDELKKRGLRVDNQLIFTWQWSEWFSGALMSKAPQLISQIVDRLIDGQKADALLFDVTPSPLVVGVAQEIRERGCRIPEDVAVMALRDSAVYQFIRPALSAIEVHHEAVALPMVQMLERMLDPDHDAGLSGNVLVAPELIVREST